MRRAAWIVLVLVGCGGSSGSRTTSASSGAPSTTTDSAERPAVPSKSPEPQGPTAACTEQANQLGASLRDLSRVQPGFLPIVRGIHAPPNKAAKPVDKPGVVVAIAADGSMYMQGYRFAGLQGVAEYLEDAWRRAVEKTIMDGGTAADATMPLYIWADRGVPTRTIVDVAALADSEKRGKVAFPPRKAPAKKADDPPPPDDDPPPPEEEDAASARQQAIKQARDAGILGDNPAPRPTHFMVRLIVTSTDKPAAIDPAVGAKLPASEPEATEAVVQQLKTAIGTCEPILTTLGTLTLEGTPEKQTAKLVADIPTSLTSCNCKVASADDLSAGLRLWLGAWAPALQWIELPKLKANDKQPIGKRVK